MHDTTVNGEEPCVMPQSHDRQQIAPPEFQPGAESADLTPQLRSLVAGETLTEQAASEAFGAMMSGAVHHGEMGALLALLARRKTNLRRIGWCRSGHAQSCHTYSNHTPP